MKHKPLLNTLGGNGGMKCKKCNGTGQIIEYMIGPGDPSYTKCVGCEGSGLENVTEEVFEDSSPL